MDKRGICILVKLMRSIVFAYLSVSSMICSFMMLCESCYIVVLFVFVFFFVLEFLLAIL